MGNKESNVRLRIEENDNDSEDEDEKSVQKDFNTERDKTPTPVMPYKTKTQELSPSLVEKVRHCLGSLPLTNLVLTDELVERLTGLIVVREYKADQDVICQGLKSIGIFIIDEGRVQVMTSAGEVIADLFKGDYFGEVSVLYKVPCTATVRTNGKCRLLLLEEKVNRKLLGKAKVKMEMMDWFVKKRYIPVSASINQERTVRRMVLTYLRKVPLFADWSDSALRSLVLEIKPALIVLYPPGSVVAMHGDPPVTVNVIIRGRAVLCDQDRVTLAEIDVHTDPVVIGEEGVLLSVENEVTVVTKTCCEVIPIRTEWIQNVVHHNPHEAGTAWSFMQEKWMAQVNKKSRIYFKFPANLQFEVIYQLMKQSRLLRECDDRCVYDLCLHGSPQEFFPGELVCTKEEYDQHIFVLILMGDIELVTYPQMSWEYTLETGDIFCRCDWMEDIGQLEAVGHCLVVKLSQKNVLQAIDSSPDSILNYPPDPQHHLP